VKKLLFILVIVGLLHQASAQIMYTDLNPDKSVSTWNVYTFHLSDASPSYLGYGTVNLWFHPWTPNQVVALTGTDCEIMVNSLADKLPLKLQQNDTISSEKIWSSVSYNPLNIGNSQGLWLGGVSNRYLGIRFKLSTGGNWFYGWARLDVDVIPDSFTVKDYAYNAEKGSNEIAAGKISNSGIDEKRPFVSTYLISDPTRKSMIIHFPNAEKTGHTISIYNMNGQLVKKVENINTTEVRIETSDWKSGVYLYQLVSQTGIKGQGKFLVGYLD
jgi:hypothetical protein